jgi:hypothetical protein
MNAPTLQQLREMTDEEIIRLHDSHTHNTVIGLQFIHDEINRRNQDKQTVQMVRLTKQITVMTVIMTIATIANLIVAIILLRK